MTTQMEHPHIHTVCSVDKPSLASKGGFYISTLKTNKKLKKKQPFEGRVTFTAQVHERTQNSEESDVPNKINI